MCKLVIKNEAVVNVDPLVVGDIDGIQFLARLEDVKHLGAAYRLCETIPRALPEYVIEFDLKERVQLYPLKEEGMARLGVLLSRFLGTEVRLSHNGEWVKAWNMGLRVDPKYGLACFFAKTIKEAERSCF